MREHVPYGGGGDRGVPYLVDSTALLARLGDDRTEELRRAHVQEVTGVVAAAGGRLIKTLGDGGFESALGVLGAATGIQASVERLDAAQGAIGDCGEGGRRGRRADLRRR
jgi:class 3 adenylate cyclase